MAIGSASVVVRPVWFAMAIGNASVVPRIMRYMYLQIGGGRRNLLLDHNGRGKCDFIPVSGTCPLRMPFGLPICRQWRMPEIVLGKAFPPNAQVTSRGGFGAWAFIGPPDGDGLVTSTLCKRRGALVAPVLFTGFFVGRERIPGIPDSPSQFFIQ